MDSPTVPSALAASTDLHSTFLSRKALARRWMTSAPHLANLASEGRGPAYVKIGTRVLYPVDAVLAYEAARLVQPVAA